MIYSIINTSYDINSYYFPKRHNPHSKIAISFGVHYSKYFLLNLPKGNSSLSGDIKTSNTSYCNVLYGDID